MGSNVPRLCIRSAKREASPCKDCGDRTVGCHGACEKYQAYCEKNKEDYQKRIQSYGAEYLLESYEVHSKLRVMKRQGR